MITIINPYTSMYIHINPPFSCGEVQLSHIQNTTPMIGSRSSRPAASGILRRICKDLTPMHCFGFGSGWLLAEICGETHHLYLYNWAMFCSYVKRMVKGLCMNGNPTTPHQNHQHQTFRWVCGILWTIWNN